MQPSLWWRTTAAAVAFLAAILPLAARALIGPLGARVHVRWQPTTDQVARLALEARFQLADGERLDRDTWRYDLTDPSSANIRALVEGPAVADTHNIDRPNYAVDPSAVRTARRQRLAAGGDAAVLAADGLALTLALAAALLIVMGTSGRAPTPRAVPRLLSQMLRRSSSTARGTALPVTRFLQRGIPDLDAATAGIFRIVFGIAVLAFFASHRFGPSVLDDVKFNVDLPVSVLAWLRGHPYIVDLLTPWLLATGVAFTAGVFTRLTYTLFVVGLIAWAFVAVYADSTHPHSTLVLTLVALLPSRWGDAFSVDAWLRRRRGRSEAVAVGKQYGYSVWVPGLVFGVAFAAAAWAKLSAGPSWASWVLNGTIKYHFVTDSVSAPIDWGLQFVNYPRLAVLASLAAVATEALVVTAAFVRTELYRLGLGMVALAMLAGFWLFMGVFWAGWWILLLGFLPWQRLSRLSLPGIVQVAGRGGLAECPPSALQLAVIVTIITQQVVMSALIIEQAPMFTHYPMYSSTWASLDDFNASRPPVYRVVAETDRGKLELRCNPSERLVTEFREALEGSVEATATAWRWLRGCGENLSDARQVVFEGYWRRFDRERMELTWTRAATTLGPLVVNQGAGSSNVP